MGAVAQIYENEQLELSEQLNEQSEFEFEEIEKAYENTISEINKSWHIYWYNYFRKRFTNNALLEEVRKHDERADYYLSELERIDKESSSWLNENIELGKQIDDLKHQVNVLREKNMALRDKIKVYEADKSLVKRFAQSVQLKAENSVLREHNNELKVKAAVTGATTLSQKQEKQIIDFYNMILSKSGKVTKSDRETIAQKVGTSESTVYRRIKNHEQQQ